MTATPHFDPATVRAVVFDIGGVFLYPAYRPVEEMLVERSLPVPGDTVVFRAAHHAGARALTERAGVVREHAIDFWTVYDDAYAAALGVPPELRDGFRVAIRTAWDWAHDDNIAAFHRLAATGMPLAIVSNNDGTAAQQMIDHGVCQIGTGPCPSVAVVVDSGVIGIAKPDPAIMAPALDALGLPCEEVLYVGDTVHADVVGATNAGMQVVQLDPFDHHVDYGHTRLPDVDTLVRLLDA
ncbi:MAG: HAD family hydrolase [Acidimicrobiales bacterium]